MELSVLPALRLPGPGSFTLGQEPQDAPGLGAVIQSVWKGGLKLSSPCNSSLHRALSRSERLGFIKQSFVLFSYQVPGNMRSHSGPTF